MTMSCNSEVCDSDFATEEDSRSQSTSTTSDSHTTNGSRKLGKCKWFNVAKGWGFITPYDGSQEVFVHQSVLQMSGFRSLGENEEVEYEWKESEKGLEATVVTGPQGEHCIGSHLRPKKIKKKHKKKIRCYNCGDLAHHVAAKCSLGPQPKTCHHCKSTEHFIAQCPKRKNLNNNEEYCNDQNIKKKLNGGDTDKSCKNSDTSTSNDQ